MKNLFLNKNTKIAVIGFGRFGQLLVHILLTNSQAKIILVENRRIKFSHKNLSVGTADKIKDADVIIPCIPISNFENLIKQISSLVKKNAIIIDVCSVKILPVKIMKTFLPKSVQIIATHPMFGPDSFKINKSLKGLKLVIWNISAKEENYFQVKKFFSSLGLKIVELSPKDHDKFMAFSLAYSYFIGKIGQRLNIKKTPIDTYDFELLLEHVSIIKADSEQLFLDMQTKNPFAKKMLTKVNKTHNNLLEKINNEIN